MADDELDLVPGINTPPEWLPKSPASDTPAGKEPGFLSTAGSLIKAGGYSTVAGLAGAAEYAKRTLEDRGMTPYSDDTKAEDLKEWGRAGVQESLKDLTPQQRKDMDANWLPGGNGPSVWDKDVSMLNSIAMNAGMSLPSLLVSIVPGTLVAKVAGGMAGTVAAGSAGSTLTAGSLYEQIQSDYKKLDDKELRKQVELYDYLRTEGGMDEKAARRSLERSVISAKPIIMGAITAMTQAFGVEHLAANLVAGTAAKGVAKNALRGAAGELAQETLESGAESVLTQQGNIEGKGGKLDWYKALDDAIKGGVVGGVLGGGTGAVFGSGGHADGHEDAKPEAGNKIPTTPDQEASAEPVQAGPTNPATPVAEPTEQAPSAPAEPAVEGSQSLEEDVDFNQDDAVSAPSVIGDASAQAALTTPPQVQTAATEAASETVPTATSGDVGSSEYAALTASTPQGNDGPSAQDIAKQLAVQTSAAPVSNPVTAAAPIAEPITASAPQVAPPTASAPIAEPQTSAAPRVLPSQTPEAMQAQEALATDWKQRGADTRAELRQTGELPTKERVRDLSTVSGDAIAALPREKWTKAAQRIAEQAGQDAPATVHAAVELIKNRDESNFGPRSQERAKLNQLIDAMQVETAKFYKAIEESRAIAAKSGFDTNKDAVSSGLEQKGAKGRKLLKDRAERASDGSKEAVTSSKPDVDEAAADLTKRSKALAKRLGNIILDAEARGVSIPEKVTEATPCGGSTLAATQRGMTAMLTSWQMYRLTSILHAAAPLRR